MFSARVKPGRSSGLIATVAILFGLQGRTILDRPAIIALIAVPILIQSYLIFAIGYGAAWLMRVPHRIAAPCAMIGTSNFFELAVAVAISLFGLNSGAALATVVGVLVEVPVMLSLVAFANRTGPVSRRSRHDRHPSQSRLRHIAQCAEHHPRLGQPAGGHRLSDRGGWARAQLLALLAAASLTPPAKPCGTKSPAAGLGLLSRMRRMTGSLAAMLDHPVLVDRPIVASPKGVRLYRPSESSPAASRTACRPAPCSGGRAGDL